MEKPTGKGKMPEPIQCAKEINSKIHSMINAGTLEEEEVDADELPDGLDMLHDMPEPGAVGLQHHLRW